MTTNETLKEYPVFSEIVSASEDAITMYQVAILLEALAVEIEAIKNAPHGPNCLAPLNRLSQQLPNPCNCFKAKALAKIAKLGGVE